MAAIEHIQSGFIFLLYFVLRAIGLPFLVLYFVCRGYRDRRYFQKFGERLGSLPASFERTASGSIWLHAVSVGEVISSIRLIEELRHANPMIPIYLSTTTLAGRAVADERAAPLLDGVFYAPVDYAFAVRRVMRAIRPAILVVLETEIWPVLWHEAKRAHCRLMVLNGRISDRALPRYRSFRFVFGPVLHLPNAILAQSERDRRRYVELGALEECIRTLGNLKYDAAVVQGVPPAFVIELLERLRPDAVWIAASTMPGVDAEDIDEDDFVIRAFEGLKEGFGRLLLILAPRKPERFEVAAEKLRAAGIPFVRRSEETIPVDLPSVLLLDSLGELASIFRYAKAVFVGGTLARRGGHNVLEPAICAKPIIVGPHMENFATIAEQFREHEAWVQVANPDELAGAVARVLSDGRLSQQLGERAEEIALSNAGVAKAAAAEILAEQDLAIPNWKQASVMVPLLRVFALIWRAGNWWKQYRDLKRSRALNSPVISVGAIAMGGTGKTPFVDMLARALRQGGVQPAILTRGYRRRSLDKFVLLSAGAPVSSWYTGDEAQIFVRSGQAHIGIGADRWATGHLLEERLRTDVFLLDDGFQHRRLQRNIDIVLIDAMDPFPGRGIFPAGWMREPLSGLRRADAFIITRVQPLRNYEGIRRVLEAQNSKAPIYTAIVKPVGWVEESTRRSSELPSGPLAAFCGLGNPLSFWQTLREQAIDPVYTWRFGDHHVYRPVELQRLAKQAIACGAEALLTTEKDAMNLPNNASELVWPLAIYWLKIAVVVREDAELMSLVQAKCRTAQM